MTNNKDYKYRAELQHVYDIPETVASIDYYGRDGKLVDEVNSYAEHRTINGADTYYIWCWNGTYYDVYNDNAFKRNDSRAKLTRVNKDIFNEYVKFLKTKHNIYLVQARRLPI